MTSAINNLSLRKSDTKIRIGAILLAIYAAIVPLENILTSSFGGSVNKYIGILLIVYAIVSFWVFKNQNKALVFDNKWLLVFSVYSLLSILWTKFDYLDSYVTIIVGMLFMYLVVSKMVINKDERKMIITFMAVSGLIISLMLLLGFGLSSTSVNYEGETRSTITVGSSEADNNNLAIGLALNGISALWLFLYREKPRKMLYYVFWFLVFLLISVSVFYTGSRGGLLAYIGGIFLLFFSKIKRHRFSKIIAFACLSLILYFALINLLPANISNRFQISTILSSGGTGRFDIWSSAFSTFGESDFFRKLFGHGWSSFGSTMKYTQGFYLAAHNDFVQLLIEVGIIGSVLYVFTLFTFFRISLSKKDSYLVSLLMVVVLGSLSMELIVKKMLWLVFIFISTFPNKAKRIL